MPAERSNSVLLCRWTSLQKLVPFDYNVRINVNQPRHWQTHRQVKWLTLLNWLHCNDQVEKPAFWHSHGCYVGTCHPLQHFYRPFPPSLREQNSPVVRASRSRTEVGAEKKNAQEELNKFEVFTQLSNSSDTNLMGCVGRKASMLLP